MERISLLFEKRKQGLQMKNDYYIRYIIQNKTHTKNSLGIKQTTNKKRECDKMLCLME